MNTDNKSFILDATGEKIGRIASRASSLLTGKNRVDFAKNKVFSVKVLINNASKLDITEKRLETIYKRYSGYPGGIHEKTMRQQIDKKGRSFILKSAILGMIPNNKLKSRIIKNLSITE